MEVARGKTRLFGQTTSSYFWTLFLLSACSLFVGAGHGSSPGVPKTCRFGRAPAIGGNNHTIQANQRHVVRDCRISHSLRQFQPAGAPARRCLGRGAARMGRSHRVPRGFALVQAFRHVGAAVSGARCGRRLRLHRSQILPVSACLMNPGFHQIVHARLLKKPSGVNIASMPVAAQVRPTLSRSSQEAAQTLWSWGRSDRCRADIEPISSDVSAKLSASVSAELGQTLGPSGPIWSKVRVAADTIRPSLGRFRQTSARFQPILNHLGRLKDSCPERFFVKVAQYLTRNLRCLALWRPPQIGWLKQHAFRAPSRTLL